MDSSKMELNPSCLLATIVSMNHSDILLVEHFFHQEEDSHEDSHLFLPSLENRLSASRDTFPCSTWEIPIHLYVC